MSARQVGNSTGTIERGPSVLGSGGRYESSQGQYTREGLFGPRVFVDEGGLSPSSSGGYGYFSQPHVWRTILIIVAIVILVILVVWLVMAILYKHRHRDDDDQ